MQRYLCIHGHFYQPPREDPWLHKILPEGSAAPMRHWNERICRECYGPLGWARRADGEGRITELINSYEWISFNFGPTLMKWLERADPKTYARVLAGDAASVKRLGHGNAMAQVYHHVIMPLASALDKEAEVAWAISDFKARFCRDPEGMWLAEAAVDTATLEVLAAQGIAYTVLAPRQSMEIADIGLENWTPTNEYNLDIRDPYRVELPSGRSIAVFFYSGPFSQAVAFERLLENGENFWRRLSGFFQGQGGDSLSGLLSVATDGETYGHHFKFGEMALAYVLAQTFFGRDEIKLTNFGAYLAERPPRRKVRLVEPSSWSCFHGVERWRADCGCTTGDAEGWNQRWRGPLRVGLDRMKQAIDAHFFSAGPAFFKDSVKTFVHYGEALSGLMAQDDFAKQYFKAKLSAEKQRTAWKLLAMQQWALASLASCAWFFDELSRIEPLNGLTYALRAMELAAATGGPNLSELEGRLLQELSHAESNMREKGTGKDLYLNEVKPRQENGATLAAQSLISLWSEDRFPGSGEEAMAWPGVSTSVTCLKNDRTKISGELAVSWALEPGAERYAWSWTSADSHSPLDGTLTVSGVAGEPTANEPVRSFRASDLPWNKRQGLSLHMIEFAEERAWHTEETRMRASLRLFQTWQEYQTTQNLAERWTRFWPTLAWLYVLGADLATAGPASGRSRAQSAEQVRCLAGFLRIQGRCHPDRELVGSRVAERTLVMLESTPPLFTSVERMLQRVGEIELPVDWWQVQNKLWELGIEDQQARNVARMVNFKV